MLKPGGDKPADSSITLTFFKLTGTGEVDAVSGQLIINGGDRDV